MLEVGYVRDDETREMLVGYLASEGVDANEARSMRFLDDGRLEVEMYLFDREGNRRIDLSRGEIPTAIRTVDPIFCPPTDLIVRLSSLAA